MSTVRRGHNADRETGVETYFFTGKAVKTATGGK
jgi:hypothetical protein